MKHLMAKLDSREIQTTVQISLTSSSCATSPFQPPSSNCSLRPNRVVIEIALSPSTSLQSRVTTSCPWLCSWRNPPKLQTSEDVDTAAVACLIEVITRATEIKSQFRPFLPKFPSIPHRIHSGEKKSKSPESLPRSSVEKQT